MEIQQTPEWQAIRDLADQLDRQFERDHDIYSKKMAALVTPEQHERSVERHRKALLRVTPEWISEAIKSVEHKDTSSRYSAICQALKLTGSEQRKDLSREFELYRAKCRAEIFLSNR